MEPTAFTSEIFAISATVTVMTYFPHKVVKQQKAGHALTFPLQTSYITNWSRRDLNIFPWKLQNPTKGTAEPVLCRSGVSHILTAMASNDVGLSYYWWHANSLPPIRECTGCLRPGRYYFREKNPTEEAANAACVLRGCAIWSGALVFAAQSARL